MNLDNRLVLSEINYPKPKSASNIGYILTNGIIINGTGEAPICNKSIVIRDNQILEIISNAMLKNYQAYSIINVKQTFILPGFINAHVHNQLNASNLKAWAKAGVTMVRDLGYSGNSKSYFDRIAVLNSDKQKARTVASGPLLTTVGGYGLLGLNSFSDVRNQVDRLINEGAGIIKLAIEDNLQGRTWPI